MSEDLKTKFNELSLCFDLIDNWGSNLVGSEIVTDEIQKQIMEKVKAEDIDIDEIDNVYAQYMEFTNRSLADDEYEKAIEVSKRMLNIGDRNMRIITEVIGEDKMKEFVVFGEDDRAETARKVAGDLKLPTVKFLLS